MRALIIGFNNLEISPYIKMYSDYLDVKGIDYRIAFPNRDGRDYPTDERLYALPWDKSKSKIINFLAFRGKMKKLLKRNKFDFVFVMPTFPAVLLSGLLSRNYREKYLVDIRDRTHEHNSLYFSAEKRVVNNSAMNVISSPGFSSFLPEAEYIFCPNVSATGREPKYRFSRCTGRRVNVSYVGTVSCVAASKRFVDAVAADDRFTLDFYGSETHGPVLSQYISELGCDRVKYHSAFLPSEKAGIIEGSDLLLNVYGIRENPAFANKMYDSMYFKKPLISDFDSLMQKECGEYSYPADLDDADMMNKIYEWYTSLDGEAYNSFADRYLERTYRELDVFYERLDKILFGEEK